MVKMTRPLDRLIADVKPEPTPRIVRHGEGEYVAGDIGGLGVVPQMRPALDPASAFRERNRANRVPPAGFEPALPPPEGGALSPELRGPSLVPGEA